MKELLVINDDKVELVKDAVCVITEIETRIKELKELQDQYKAQLLEQMEEYNVIKIDVPELCITRKAATTRETFDSKSLREENPDVYDNYVKISDVKGSITIKIK